MTNQLLVHIGNTPVNLMEYCRQKDILVEAYSPVAHGEILRNPEVIAMAEKYQVTVPLPKTSNPKHMSDNIKVDFVISDEDMQILKQMKPLTHYGEFSRFPAFSGK